MTDPSFHPAPEDLFAYRDGELPVEKRSLIEAHVSGCRACRGRIDRVSGLEAALRQRPDEVADEYYAALADSVVRKIGAGAEAREEAVAPAPEPEPVAPARRRVRESEAPRRARAPGFPWAPLVSTVAAAGAVVVVVVMLFQQGALRRPGVPGAADRVVLRGGVPGESAKTPQGGTGGPAGGVAAPEGGAVESGTAPQTVTRAKGEAKPPATGAGPGETVAIGTPERTEPEPPAQLEEVARADEAREKKETVAAKARDIARNAAPAPAATAPTPSALAAPRPGSAYEALVGRYGLPPVYDAGRSPGDAILRAEPALRLLYMGGGAGTDSARVRLYLAEASRLRYEAQPDSTLYDGVVHHYWRTIRLAIRTLGPGSDVERIARERLEGFSR
jgi:anti-sigma factor RsiW